MCSLSPTRTVRKPREYQQLPDVQATGTLTTGTDRLADLFAGAAVLAVTKGDDSDRDVTLYWAQAILDAGKVVCIDLTKFGTGEKYRVGIDGDRWECDCPDCCYRTRICKHIGGLRDALSYLEPLPSDPRIIPGCNAVAVEEGFCHTHAIPF
jgi:hypothetical protein